MPLKLSAAAAVAAFMVVPGAADAATVKVVVDPLGYGSSAGIEYRAVTGESNRVELFSVNETTVRVVDPGASITPGAGCSPTASHAVLCTTAVFQDELLIVSNVFTGDMNDVIGSHDVALSADGGPGNDWIESDGGGAGVLNGGGGRDVLLGGTSRDTLIDGDRSGAADSDVLDGRQGGAVVSYADRTAPVHVDLVAFAPAGERGEGDLLRGVTGAIGGSAGDVLRGSAIGGPLTGGAGDDHLYGSDRLDVLDGGPGNDRLSGRGGADALAGGAGDDRLLGSRGADTLDGGAGDDLLRGGRGPDQLAGGAAHCGPGYDTAIPSTERDRLRSDCELAHFDLPLRIADDFSGIDLVPYPVKRDRMSVTFRGWCPEGGFVGRIDLLRFSGTVTLTARGRVIAHVPLTVRPKGRCAPRFIRYDQPPIRIPVALNHAGRRLLSSGRRTDVTVSFRGRHVPRNPFIVTLK